MVYGGEKKSGFIIKKDDKFSVKRKDSKVIVDNPGRWRGVFAEGDLVSRMGPSPFEMEDAKAPLLPTIQFLEIEMSETTDIKMIRVTMGKTMDKIGWSDNGVVTEADTEHKILKQFFNESESKQMIIPKYYPGDGKVLNEAEVSYFLGKTKDTILEEISTISYPISLYVITRK